MRAEITETVQEVVELLILQELRQLRGTLNKEAFSGISGIELPPEGKNWQMDITPIAIPARRQARHKPTSDEKLERTRAYGRAWYAKHKKAKANKTAKLDAKQSDAMKEISGTRSADEV